MGNFWVTSITNSIRIVDFQYRSVPKRWSSDLHRHNIFEFIYIVSGKIDEQVCGYSYALNEGDSVLIKPSTYHISLPITQDTVYLNFHFELEDKRIHEILQRVQNPMIKAKSNKDIQNSITNFISKYSEFLKDLEQKDGEDSIYFGIKLLEVQSYILHLISLISNHFYHSNKKAQSTSTSRTSRQLALEASYLIEKNAMNNIKINEIANMLNVDRSYLSKCFKGVYGMPPQNYLINTRIRKAKELLIDTNWSIEHIAQNLNFSSTAHFSIFFSKATGFSPSEFRTH